jgi:hypothetical protein
MAFLSHRLHGVLDYATVLFLALAPTLFGLNGFAAYMAYGLAGAHLSVTVLTAFPLGVFALIPPMLHAAVELVVGVSLLAAPWLAPGLFAGGQCSSLCSAAWCSGCGPSRTTQGSPVWSKGVGLFLTRG